MDLGLGRKEILVWGLSGIEGRVSGYVEYVFFKIDIETQDDSVLVSSTCCPSLFNKNSNYDAKLVNLGSSIIYIIGNKDEESEWEESEGEGEDPCPDSVACLNHAAWIDLSEISPEWRPAPCPTYNTFVCQCVPLSAKIYSLGYFRFIPEVYNHPDNNNNNDGGGGCWVELPPPPSHLKDVSFNPIPDPDNDRIIAHIDSAIYAFKPNDKNNQWERLSPPDDDFLYWDTRSAVVDGVVSIAHDGRIEFIRAYDLADSTRQLEVEWSNNSTYPDHMTGVEFDAALNLGNGFLCLAVYTPLDPPRSIRVYFVLLSFIRQTPDVVTFTYHYSRSYDLADTTSVLDFVALDNFHSLIFVFIVTILAYTNCFLQICMHSMLKRWPLLFLYCDVAGAYGMGFKVLGGDMDF